MLANTKSESLQKCISVVPKSCNYSDANDASILCLEATLILAEHRSRVSHLVKVNHQKIDPLCPTTRLDTVNNRLVNELCIPMILDMLQQRLELFGLHFDFRSRLSFHVHEYYRDRRFLPASAWP